MRERVPEKLKQGWRRCAECRWTFRPKNRIQRFCSKQCRNLSNWHKWHGGHRRAYTLDGEDYRDMVALFVTGEWTFAMIGERYHITSAYAQEVINRKSGEYHAPAYKRVCLWCGVAFEAHYSHQIYCSSGHAAQASGKRLRQAAKAKRENAERSPRLTIALRYARWRRDDYNAFGEWDDGMWRL